MGEHVLHLRKKGFQLIFGEVVHLVAELASELGLSLFRNQVGQFLSAHADQGAAYSLPRAVAPVFYGVLLQNLQVEIGQNSPQKPLAVQSERC